MDVEDTGHRRAEAERITQLVGDTLISRLRAEIGEDFAPGASPNAKVSHVINVMDDRSFRKLAQLAQ
ncbi:MAG: hypothetical protein ABSF50_04700 [Burkholderiaceae bacterium]